MRIGPYTKVLAPIVFEVFLHKCTSWLKTQPANEWYGFLLFPDFWIWTQFGDIIQICWTPTEDASGGKYVVVLISVYEEMIKILKISYFWCFFPSVKHSLSASLFSLLHPPLYLPIEVCSGQPGNKVYMTPPLVGRGEGEGDGDRRC